ncbi:MAG: glycosyltransferase family 39 protein [bacterium]
MIRHDLPNRLDWFIAVLVFATTLGVLLATMNIGFTRDETFYFHAANQYIGWFEQLWVNLTNGQLAQSFTKSNIDAHWSYNPEHPVLMKALFALTHKLFFEKLAWMSESTAFRLPGAVSASALVALVFVWGRELGGRWAGGIAAAALILQPRFFFHAHMACFDVPVTFFWFAVVYAYWRSFESKRWIVFAGILWGLALSTKLNAFFLPFVLGGHWVVANARLIGRDDQQKWRFPKFPWVFASMLVFGTTLFFALWPRHWFDTVARVKWYLDFHLKHVHYFVDYFGQNLQHPPFPVSFPWVMTLVTVPATILVAGGLGAAMWWLSFHPKETLQRWIGDWQARAWYSPSTNMQLGLLFFINIVFPIALISMPDTPVFGGTKHWMPAMPFLAILAGLGCVWSAQRLRFDGMRQHAAVAAAALALTVPALLQAAHIHPFGTGYYNEFIGSVRGAADAGMMRQFWGYASRQSLPWLNEHATERAGVFTHNTTGGAWAEYRKEGLVRKDLRPVGLAASQYALFHHQKAFGYIQIELWDDYGNQAPVHVVGVDGVPYLSVYERKVRK